MARAPCSASATRRPTFTRGRAAATFVRAAYFMENWGGALFGVAQGVLPSFLLADKAIPMVATRDIGIAAARLLAEGGSGKRVIELAGPREYSPRDVAAALARAVGKPIAVQEAPEDAMEPALAAAGMNAEWARLFQGAHPRAEYGDRCLGRRPSALARGNRHPNGPLGAPRELASVYFLVERKSGPDGHSFLVFESWPPRAALPPTDSDFKSARLQGRCKTHILRLVVIVGAPDHGASQPPANPGPPATAPAPRRQSEGRDCMTASRHRVFVAELAGAHQ